VICVGNLTAGGSGKTPVAIAIAEMLRARGHRPYFITRGYGGSERGPALATRGHTAEAMGDEALLLARTAPTIVARDRASGARLAKNKGASVLVMDDGHQNFALRKNLSLVVVDAETGFGNGRQIPAGPLREPVAQGLSRADAVIVMGSEASEDGRAAKRAQASMPDLKGYAGPVLRAHLAADGAAFAGKHVFAFAGIGRPEKFTASLEQSDAHITGSCFFADHHPYGGDEITQLKMLAGDAMLVTTEKDFVRLSIQQRENIRVLKINAVFDDAAAMDGLLDTALVPV
jgi:tetraacyldisaccharide 4'-kinase